MNIFEFKLSNGSDCKIEAVYQNIMEKEPIYADGDIFYSTPKPSDIGSEIAAYVNGKRVSNSTAPCAWKLSTTSKNGKAYKCIPGLRIMFVNDADAERYAAWLEEIFQAGKSTEVKEYEAEKEALHRKKLAEEAKKIIKCAEAQKDIPSHEEAARRMKEYNDFMNEGGEGYVPHIYSQEEYEWAKNIMKEEKI